MAESSLVQYWSHAFSNLTHFYLPPVRTSLPFSCFPKHASVGFLADEWARAALHRKPPAEFERLLEQQISYYQFFVAPNASDEDANLASTKWMWLSTLVDDPFDIEWRTKEQQKEAFQWLQILIQAFANGITVDLGMLEESSTGPIAKASAALMGELKTLLSPLQYRRLTSAQMGWAKAVKQKMFHIEHGTFPQFDEYIQQRRYASLYYPVFILVEASMGLRLNEDDAKKLQPLLNALADHGNMIHEILSFRKDLYEETSGIYHILGMLCIHKSSQISRFQDAIDTLVTMIEAKEQELLHILHSLWCDARMSGNKSMLKYLDEIPLLAGGNLQWMYMSPRYHGYGNPQLPIKGLPASGKPSTFHGWWKLDPKHTIICSERPAAHGVAISYEEALSV